MGNVNWQGPFNRMLCRLALKEYRAQKAAWVKRGRKASTFRYAVPEWQADAVAAMGTNDEEKAKAAILYR